MNSNIKSLVQKHGVSKVKALIKCRPLNLCMGMIAFTSSSDKEMPILCEITERRYTVDEGYKIGWCPIAEYAPQKRDGFKLMEQNGFASEIFYQSDFDSLVESGQIKLFIEA
jgi:hypothetical protein